MKAQRILHNGRVAFLVMLVLNLTVSVFYQQLFAQDPPMISEGAEYAQGCPANQFTMTPEIEELLSVQEQIHNDLFESQFTWCTGSMWLLDQDVTEEDVPDPWSPATITGLTIGGDDFVAEVYHVITIDWASYDLSNESREFAEEIDYQYRYVGMNVTGVMGSVELWGILQTVTNTDASYTHVTLFPISLGEIIPIVLPEYTSLNCDNPQTQYEACLCNARDSYDLCMEHAKENFLAIIGVETGTAIGYWLGCLSRDFLLAFTPAGGAFSMTRCTLQSIIGLLVAIGAAWFSYEIAKKQCSESYALAIAMCNRSISVPDTDEANRIFGNPGG